MQPEQQTHSAHAVENFEKLALIPTVGDFPSVQEFSSATKKMFGRRPKELEPLRAALVRVDAAVKQFRTYTDRTRSALEDHKALLESPDPTSVEPAKWRVYPENRRFLVESAEALGKVLKDLSKARNEIPPEKVQDKWNLTFNKLDTAIRTTRQSIEDGLPQLKEASKIVPLVTPQIAQQNTLVEALKHERALQASAQASIGPAARRRTAELPRLDTNVHDSPGGPSYSRGAGIGTNNPVTNRGDERLSRLSIASFDSTDSMVDGLGADRLHEESSPVTPLTAPVQLTPTPVSPVTPVSAESVPDLPSLQRPQRRVAGLSAITAPRDPVPSELPHQRTDSVRTPSPTRPKTPDQGRRKGMIFS
jgi:hypothetical protein